MFTFSRFAKLSRLIIKNCEENVRNWTANVRNNSTDTIFSLSSGYGKCGVSVIRVSGKRSLEAFKLVTNSQIEPKPRYAYLKSLYHPSTRDVIDRGLVLWFPGPRSFTGEDCCELQVHGSIAVVEAMLDGLASIPGLRLAQPGEYTKRSFFNGKLDLTEVEGLADLIRAETEAQRKQALLQSNGALSKLYKGWRQRIIKSIAHLEAYIDFAEDENIEDETMTKLLKDLREMQTEIERHINDNRQGEILRNGIRTVIIGAPNVGKSSFINLICQRQISIVTPIAGTTRDVVESSYNIGGYPVVLADTAGLRSHTDDVVEKEGIGRAIDYVRQSDLIILIIDASNLNANEDDIILDYRQRYLQELGIKEEYLSNRIVFTLVNKIDLLNEARRNTLLAKINGIHFLSCKDGTNLDSVLHSLTASLASICGGQPTAECPRISQSRYRHHLVACVQHLQNFQRICEMDKDPDLAIAAQKLRLAVRCIGRITGDVSAEEILDVIFHDFCIGK